MPQKPEPRDVGARVGPLFQHESAGGRVEARHLGEGLSKGRLGDFPIPVGADDGTGSDGLRQDQGVPRPGCGVAHYLLRIHETGHGEAVLELGILDRVSSHQSGTRFTHFLGAAAQDVRQDGSLDPPGRKTADVQRGERTASHGIDIGKGVGGGHLAENHRIVHDGGDEVHRLHEGGPRVESIHPRVVGGTEPHQKIRIPLRFQPFHDFSQVLRTELRRSTARMRVLHQPLSGAESHRILL